MKLKLLSICFYKFKLIAKLKINPNLEKWGDNYFKFLTNYNN